MPEIAKDKNVPKRIWFIGGVGLGIELGCSVKVQNWDEYGVYYTFADRYCSVAWTEEGTIWVRTRTEAGRRLPIAVTPA